MAPVLRALLWPVRPWLESGHLLLFRLELAGFARASRRADVTGEWAGADSLDDLVTLCGARSAADQRARARLIDERLQRGARPFLLRDTATGQPLHVRWVTRQAEQVPECGLLMRPGPDEAYLFDAFTAHRARGRGLSGHGRRLMASALRAAGVSRVYWYVVAANFPSLRSVPPEATCAQRLGFLRVGPPGRPWLARAKGHPAPPLFGPTQDPAPLTLSMVR